jgi:hypothetical protein
MGAKMSAANSATRRTSILMIELLAPAAIAMTFYLDVA